MTIHEKQKQQANPVRNALVYISGREFKCAYDLIEARELEQRQPVTDGAHQPIVRQSERHSQKCWQWKLEYGEQMAESVHRNVLSTLIALTSVVQSEESGRLLFALLFLGECATFRIYNCWQHICRLTGAMTRFNNDKAVYVVDKAVVIN